MKEIDWGKIPLKPGVRVRWLLTEVGGEARPETVFKAVENLSQVAYGVTPEMLEQFAAHRVLLPDVAAEIAGQENHLGVRHKSAPQDEWPRRVGYARAVTTIADRGLLAPTHEDKEYLDKQTGEGFSIWEVVGKPEDERPGKYVSGGWIRPEWREWKLKDLSKDRLLELHKGARDALQKTLGKLAQMKQDGEVEAGRMAHMAEPLVRELAYQQLCVLALERKIPETYDPTSLRPESDQAKEKLMDWVEKTTWETAGHNRNVQAGLLFDFRMRVTKGMLQEETGDPNLEPMTDLANKKVRKIAFTPGNMREVFPTLEGYLPNELLDQIFTNGAFDYLTFYDFPAKKVFLELLVKLAVDKTPVRRGIVFSPESRSSVVTRGAELEFKSKSGVKVQLTRRDYEDDSTAAVEMEDTPNYSQNSNVVLYRHNKKGWERMGTLRMVNERMSNGTRVSYEPNPNYKGATNQMGFWSGVAMDRIESITVSGAYYGGGSVEISNSDYMPIIVNPYDSENPPGRMYLPRVKKLPSINEEKGYR